MEEDEVCPSCNEGIMEWPEIENCSCHVSPPCSGCVNKVLICNSCNYEDRDD